MNKEIVKIILSLVIAVTIIASAIIFKDTEYKNVWLYITCISIIVLPLVDLFSRKKKDK